MPAAKPAQKKKIVVKEADEDFSEEEEVEEKKPAPKKPAPKKQVSSSSSEESSEEDEPKITKKPAPAKPKPTQKKQESSEDESSDEEIVTKTKVAAKKPAPKKQESSEDDSEDDDSEDEKPKPKSAPVKKPVKKQESESEESEEEVDSEEEKKKKQEQIEKEKEERKAAKKAAKKEARKDLKKTKDNEKKERRQNVPKAVKKVDEEEEEEIEASSSKKKGLNVFDMLDDEEEKAQESEEESEEEKAEETKDSNEDKKNKVEAEQKKAEAKRIAEEEKKKKAEEEKKKKAEEERLKLEQQEKEDAALLTKNPADLTEAEKKRVKRILQKQKQIQPKQEPAPKKEEKKEEKEDKKAKGKKEKEEPPKKLGGALGAIAALKKAQEEKQRIEAEFRRKEEEEQKRLEEEEKKREEEEREKAKEEKKKKKELEKLKKEDKKKGKSKKDLEKEEQKTKLLLEIKKKQEEEAEMLKKKREEEKKKKDEEKKQKEFEEAAKKKEEEDKKKTESSLDEPLDSWEDLDEKLNEPEQIPEPEKKEVETNEAENETEKPQSEGKIEEEEEVDEEDEESSDEGGDDSKTEKPKKLSKDEKKKLKKQDLRSPICVVLGHVDTGKTKILDKIRNTNVQSGEAGGITQQIGATYVPMDAIKTQTKKIIDSSKNSKKSLSFDVPGLLIIDTPGHESFTNLRQRGSSLCDIAILVVDLMHGLEKTTLESIEMLKQRKVPFIVALNKIDRLSGWVPHPNSPSRDTLSAQPQHTQTHFDNKLKETLLEFSNQGINAELYWKNKDIKNVLSLVPTSAITGEGIPDLLMLMVQLTQKFMAEKITFQSEFSCTILEVKVIEGLGTTIDVILVNGSIKEGDTIVCCGLEGAIVTQVRALLTPKPLREIRVKTDYVHHKELKAAIGIKICAQGLDNAVPGSQVLLVKPNDDVEEMKEAVMEDLQDILGRVSKTDKGVFVQSSTLGSMEALLQFLQKENIPVCGIDIGPVHKKNVMSCSTMLEKAPEFALILAFDVPITKEAKELADKMGIKIFAADIIYHLLDSFVAYQKQKKEEQQREKAKVAVFPAIIKIIEGCVFRNKDPILVGVDILDGVLKIGTPLCVPDKEMLQIGSVKGIKHNDVDVPQAAKGMKVSVQIGFEKESNIMIGRHFEITDLIYSYITRKSLDALKEYFKEEVDTKEMKALLAQMKKILKVPNQGEIPQLPESK